MFQFRYNVFEYLSIVHVETARRSRRQLYLTIKFTTVLCLIKIGLNKWTMFVYPMIIYICY